MTTQLPSLPSADLTRLQAIRPRDVALACLASLQGSTTIVGRSVKPWGVANARGALKALAAEGLAETAGGRWRLTTAGQAEAERRFDLNEADWPTLAEWQLPALALRLDARQPVTRRYLADARNFYACTLAVLFDLADPAICPKLSAMRAALVWRVAAARCPDLLSAEGPTDMTGPNDPLTRTLYLRFCGLTRGNVDQATPALLRRILPGASAGVGGLRRALVRAAVQNAPAATASEPAKTGIVAEPEDFAQAVTALARKLKTPRARGGTFSGGQVAIAQVYDAYIAKGHAPLSLDEFKSRLWAAVRAGADFHLTRLDIPDLMDDDLRKRSATPTRAGDVVHFVVVE
ncbi:hypothetical protein [Dichotomicrobium thermohalophilum]|uniref:Uncharacterized protein n=1 Tax=Dichotomicrobium thermohalophilum TaxID=933063 RepID=A0A397PK18_9HYPH|nr:hypothetical protein [Dichotomicrobium thermohalophilum]RIA47497.1 hypothetical protein BXY53_2051 [Dichotomicrobium thermohalophilum]